MKSIQVIIDGIETEPIEGLQDEQAQFLIGNFLSVGFPKKVDELETHIYPATAIKKIIVKESTLMVP